MGPQTLSLPRARHRPPDTRVVFVSVSDLRCASSPRTVLSTLGLGSCLGITCYDPITKVGGLLHSMLPDSRRHHVSDPNPAMYLDRGVPALLETMAEFGSDVRRLEFKVFGGAQVLDSSSYFSIGRQNIDQMKSLATMYHLRICAWDVAGHSNRSIELYLDTGRVLLRLAGRQEDWV